MSKTSAQNVAFSDYLKSWPLYVIPHHLVSRTILKLTRLKVGKYPVISWFIKKFNVDLSDALVQDINSFKHFNDFFTRELKPDARPITTDINEIACPADGKISALGNIVDGQIFQAKGHNYSLLELLGGDEVAASQFSNGRFATIYLSPRDYHRVHIPYDGTLKQQILIPGRLFSVGPHTVKTIPRLFARNERLVVLFETPLGAMAVIMVGAINVGAIETIWGGMETPPAAHAIKQKVFQDQESLDLNKGEEMGRFNMGSTVIVLFEESIHWNEALVTGTPVKMGQSIAHTIAPLP